MLRGEAGGATRNEWRQGEGVVAGQGGGGDRRRPVCVVVRDRPHSSRGPDLHTQREREERERRETERERRTHVHTPMYNVHPHMYNVYIHTYVRVCGVCVRLCVCLCVRIYIYIYIYINIERVSLSLFPSLSLCMLCVYTQYTHTAAGFRRCAVTTWRSFYHGHLPLPPLLANTRTVTCSEI